MKYEEPRISITVFTSEDVVRTSGVSGGIPDLDDENVDNDLWL